MMMLKLVNDGKYRLLSTGRKNKILELDNGSDSSWLYPEKRSELLPYNKKNNGKVRLYSSRAYRLYYVIDEPGLSTGYHLELHIGKGLWHGYLLTGSLPEKTLEGCKIIPTEELITKPFIRLLR